jgi:hypothetical protein
MPIIRSSITAVAASGLQLERGGSSAVGLGRASRALHDQTAHRQVHRIHIQIEGIRPHTNKDK